MKKIMKTTEEILDKAVPPTTEEEMYYTRMLDEALEHFDPSKCTPWEDVKKELLQEYGIAL